MATYVFDDVEVVCIPVEYSQVQGNNCYFTVYEGAGRKFVRFGVTVKLFEGEGWSGQIVYRGTNLQLNDNSFVSLPNAVDRTNTSAISFLDDPLSNLLGDPIFKVVSVDGVRM